MNRVAFIGGLLLFSAQVNSAVTPQGSRYDSRMQTVSYNAANTTVITAGVGYLSTLLFDDEETVLDARPGMEKGWNIQKDANRVYIRAVPVTQPVMDEEGKQVSQVAEAESIREDQVKVNLAGAEELLDQAYSILKKYGETEVSSQE